MKWYNEAPMHKTRQDPHTSTQQPLANMHNFFQPQVYTMLLQGTRNKQVVKPVFVTPSIQWALLIYSLKRSYVLTFKCNRSIFLLLMDSYPNRKSSRAFSEPQALPSLVVADCGKSPNTWSDILKSLIKYTEEVDQIYWRGWSNILKILIEYTEEVEQIYWRSTKVVADCSSMPPNTWSSILDQVYYVRSSRLF